MKFEKDSFKKVTVHLDFNEFVECGFENCTMVYHGYGEIALTGCNFTDVTWTFADAAANTLQFMSRLYKGCGEGGKQLVESTFDNIRKGMN